MSITDQRPDPNTVNIDAVANVARQRVLGLTEDVLLRDAKIQEQQQYIATLEARIKEQEEELIAARSLRGDAKPAAA